jgi:hypothetical protein
MMHIYRKTAREGFRLESALACSPPIDLLPADVTHLRLRGELQASTVELERQDTIVYVIVPLLQDGTAK